MALVLILQLLTLWPLCHTDVTSGGTQEARGHKLPTYSGPPALLHKPWPTIYPVHPNLYPKPRRPIYPEPPSYPKPRRPIYPGPLLSHPKIRRPKYQLPFPSVSPTSYPRLPRPLHSVPPLSHDKIRRPKPLQPLHSVPPNSFDNLWQHYLSVFPTSYPKSPQPLHSVPPNSFDNLWQRILSVFPTSYPKPPQPLYSVPPLSHDKIRRPKPLQPFHSVPPTFYPKPPRPFPSIPRTSYTKPRLEAQPAAVVTPGTNVTLTCQAQQPAWGFALFKSGETAPALYWNVSTELAQFFLEEVTEAQGGSYHCRYQNPDGVQGIWSHPSDALELLVTDFLPRPSLVALPGRVVAPGDTVSLRCAGGLRNMSFALYRAGEEQPLGFQKAAEPWADFPLPGARAPGTYTCYYHTPAAPYVLSQRSEPLVISFDGSGSLDYTRGNLVRLGLAGLVLLCLATLVVLDWRSWRGAPAPVGP
ncbi:osteoclast-associated immunoglobulin-like receptor [Rhynchonycteris naso]